MFSAKIVKEEEDEVVVELTATEDNDVGGQVDHPFGDQPLALQFEPIAGPLALAQYHARRWRVRAENGNAVDVQCEKVKGGGRRDAQVRLFIRPEAALDKGEPYDTSPPEADDEEPEARAPVKPRPVAKKKKAPAPRPGAKVPSGR